MDYDNFTNSKKLDWFDTGPCHNKNICSKLYGTTFEDFITHARTDQNNIMCSLVAHDRLQENETDYEGDVSSIGDRAITNDVTIKIFESLSTTFIFIGI